MDPLDGCDPDLRARLTSRLDAVEARLHRCVGSDIPLVDRTGRHLAAAGGKRIRPLVTLLAAEAAAPFPRSADEPLLASATAVELLHLSTLYHDDVIDQAETRRGVASVNARWGARLAVAAGDRLTALALAEAADGGPGVPRALARTYARLVEGERLETAVVGRLDAGTDTYLAVIEAKTASLLATAAEVGAWAGGAGAGSRQALSAWGRDLGLAFQVADDLLDLTGDSRAAGKPVGRDLALGVYTWPILDALATPAGWRLRTVLAGTPPHPAPTVEEAMRIVRESGAIGRAERLVHRLLDRAERSLRRLPATPAAAALGDLGRTLTPAPAQPALTAVSG